MKAIPLIYSQPYPCSYLPGQMARPAFIHPAVPMSVQLYSELAKQGFRRSGDEVYAPYCPACSACVPVRLKVQDFVPDRSQQRCLKKNRSTQVNVTPAEFRQEHFDLYLKYQDQRHYDGNMRYSSGAEYIGFLGSSWCDTVFIEFAVNGQLAAVAVVDRLENALSAVYTFFDPLLSQFSLGTYAVLWQIDWARQQDKEFLYLGYWIKACAKMSYKSNFQPMQVLHNKQWLDFAETA